LDKGHGELKWPVPMQSCLSTLDTGPDRAETNQTLSTKSVVFVDSIRYTQGTKRIHGNRKYLYYTFHYGFCARELSTR